MLSMWDGCCKADDGLDVWWPNKLRRAAHQDKGSAAHALESAVLSALRVLQNAAHFSARNESVSSCKRFHHTVLSVSLFLLPSHVHSDVNNKLDTLPHR